MLPFTARIPLAALAATLLWPASAALAQAAEPAAPANYLDGLKQCQSVANDMARLACYDASVGRVVSASEEGEVRLVNSEDVRQTRRRLFGFTLPDINLFGNKDDANDQALDLLESTITAVSYNRRQVTFTIAEGNAVWRINSAPPTLGRIKAGDTVEFKSAALGSYFIRINGQVGVKGRRVE